MIVEPPTAFTYTVPAAYVWTNRSHAVHEVVERPPSEISVVVDEHINVQTSVLEAFEEGRYPNWDENGAPAISELTFLYASKIAQQLPKAAKNPTVYATKNGRITFQWLTDSQENKPRAVMLLSIGQDRSVLYSLSLNDHDKENKIFRFGDTLPSDVLGSIIQLSEIPAASEDIAS